MRTKKRTRSGQHGNDNRLNSRFPAGFSSNRINIQQQSQRQSHGFFPTQKPGADGLRTSSLLEDDSGEVRQAPKRFALQDLNITRYEKEFVELSLLGVGELELVY